jgi:hypothetical protein
VKGGTYAAAVALARATDQLRVLNSVGWDTDEDTNAVREALAHWQGAVPPRSRYRGRPR